MELIIHISKQFNCTPISLTNFEGYEDDSDFLQDPSQICDILPQPYRMINRIVDELYCDTWEIIKLQEERDFIERNKIRPPVFDCGITCELADRVPVCMCASADGAYIFSGVKDALIAINATKHTMVTVLDEPGVEVTSMKCVMMTPSIHVITTIDDLGVARIFSFHNERFASIKTFAETDSTLKVLTTKCELSNHADYLALAQQYPATGESHLDIYKVPVDAWTKEYDSLTAQLAKQRAQLEQDMLESLSAGASSQDVIDTEAATSKDRVHSAIISSSDPALVAIEKSFKFTAPTMVLRIKPPPPITACANTTIAALSKAIETGDVIGQGINHIFTQHIMDQKKNVFNYLHRDLLDFLPQDEEEVISEPSFHFLHQGVMTVSVDPTVPQDRPSSVVVWWTGGRFLYHYSLVKFPLKDLEQKADLVIPLARPITCSTVSPCTSLLALGLNNGTVVLWDRYIGLEKGVVDLGKASHIDSIHFINPSLTSLTPDLSLPTQVFLLVLCDKSRLNLVAFGPGAGRVETIPLCDSMTEDNGQKLTLVQPFPRLPRVLLRVERNGVIYLQDILTRSLLCQVKLPTDYEMSSPWEPVVTVGEGGQMLFVKGNLSSQSCSSVYVSDSHATGDVTEDVTAVHSSVKPKSHPDENETSETHVNQPDEPAASKHQVATPLTAASSTPLEKSKLLLTPQSQHTVEQATETEKLPKDALFVFQLRSFPVLDDHWASQPTLKPFVSHHTAQQRSEAYLKNRLAEQTERKARMQQRWGQFKQELLTRAMSVDIP